MRAKLGDEVELLHDVHERVPPIQAIQLAHDLEPYKLFFLEDAFAPEDVEYFRILRQQSAIPIAMGELLSSATLTTTLRSVADLRMPAVMLRSHPPVASHRTLPATPMPFAGRRRVARQELEVASGPGVSGVKSV